MPLRNLQSIKGKIKDIHTTWRFLGWVSRVMFHRPCIAAVLNSCISFTSKSKEVQSCWITLEQLLPGHFSVIAAMTFSAIMSLQCIIFWATHRFIGQHGSSGKTNKLSSYTFHWHKLSNLTIKYADVIMQPFGNDIQKHDIMWSFLLWPPPDNHNLCNRMVQ